MGACAAVGDRIIETKKARVFVNGESPFQAGSAVKYFESFILF